MDIYRQDWPEVETKALHNISIDVAQNLLGIGLVWLLNQDQPQVLQGLSALVTAQGSQFEGMTLQSLVFYNLALYGLTLLLVTLCGLVAHYLPLRHLRKISISSGLRGAP